MFCGICFTFGKVTFRQGFYFSVLVRHQPACLVSYASEVLEGIGMYNLKSISLAAGFLGVIEDCWSLLVSHVKCMCGFLKLFRIQINVPVIIRMLREV